MAVAMEDRLTTDEVCRELGVSKATLHRYRAQGKIIPVDKNPYLERPGKLEFTREEVERFKKERKVELAQGKAQVNQGG